MTERLYYNDSLLLKFKANVTGIDKVDDAYRVTLDQSAFYPTSGGQLFDTGNLSGIKVVDVIEENEEVYHILDEKPEFGIGDKVSGMVDHDRRFENMQKHTGQHILSAALIETCNAETVSSRLGEEDSTIEVNRESLSEEEILRAESLANRIVFENRRVKIDFVPHDQLRNLPLRKIPDREEGDFRIISVADFDCSACGGTHFQSTGSVGIIKIISREKAHGNFRIRFLAGTKALEDYRWRFEQIDKISNIFTRHGRESLQAVEGLIEENARLRKKNSELKRQLLPTSMEKWYNEAPEVNGLKVVAVDYSGDDFKEARQAALGIINTYKAVAVIASDDKLIIAISQGLPVSAADIMKKAADHFGGRGGGSPQMAQGGGFKTDDIKVLIAAPEKIFDI